MGEVDIAFFNFENEMSQFLSHTNFTFFFSKAFKGVANSARFGMNRRTKLIFPKNDWRDGT